MLAVHSSASMVKLGNAIDHLFYIKTLTQNEPDDQRHGLRNGRALIYALFSYRSLTAVPALGRASN